MKTWSIHREIRVPAPIDEVFPFFADAYNLEILTPDFLQFQINTPAPIHMAVGTLIDYQIRVHRLPIRWRTKITAWELNHRFVDEQLSGPYRLWRHEHRFIPEDGGTRCIDHVEYRPKGGALLNRLFVERDVNAIFDYREKQMKKLFVKNQDHHDLSAA